MDQILTEVAIQVLVPIACFVITTCVAYLTKKAVKWLEDRKLIDKATEAVQYAEQLFKIGEITADQRKEIAYKYMRQMGITKNLAICYAVIEAVIGGINMGTCTLPEATE